MEVAQVFQTDNQMKSIIVSIASLIIFLSLSSISYAQLGPNPAGKNANTINIGNQVQNGQFGVPAPAGSSIIGTLVKNVISLFFVFGGIATLLYFVWGAFDWIVSGGDKEKVAGARKKMTNAIIGLVLLALSYFIVGLVGEVVGFNPLAPIAIRSLGEQ